jgi:hypothetical protein
VVIASVYIGFAVADGRRTVLAVESGVASMFVIIAAAAVTGTPWLLVVGLAGHGLKDLWQHRRQFVANTRWWPPFCLVVDWVVAAIIAVEIVAGIDVLQLRLEWRPRSALAAALNHLVLIKRVYEPRVDRLTRPLFPQSSVSAARRELRARTCLQIRTSLTPSMMNTCTASERTTQHSDLQVFQAL